MKRCQNSQASNFQSSFFSMVNARTADPASRPANKKKLPIAVRKLLAEELSGCIIAFMRADRSAESSMASMIGEMKLKRIWNRMMLGRATKRIAPQFFRKRTDL